MDGQFHTEQIDRQEGEHFTERKYPGVQYQSV